jgi:hypothetical protein
MRAEHAKDCERQNSDGEEPLACVQFLAGAEVPDHQL